MGKLHLYARQLCCFSFVHVHKTRLAYFYGNVNSNIPRKHTPSCRRKKTLTNLYCDSTPVLSFTCHRHLPFRTLLIPLAQLKPDCFGAVSSFCRHLRRRRTLECTHAKIWLFLRLAITSNAGWTRHTHGNAHDTQEKAKWRRCNVRGWHCRSAPSMCHTLPICFCITFKL